MNETISTILKRKSVRTFSDKEIRNDDINTLLTAAMAGPSCVNSRDFSFLVIDDKEVLNKMADCNGRPAEPLRKANKAILVCGDLSKAFKGAPDYFVIDCAIATQNLILAATALNIGSVWLGTYPQMDRVNKLKELLKLPQEIIPHSIVALGYFDGVFIETNKLDLSVVHYNKW